MLITNQVFSSFVIQAVIALLGFLALLVFRSRLASTKKKLHTDAIVTALVDFHKSQCYLSITIQIIALIIIHDTLDVRSFSKTTTLRKSKDSTSDPLNISVLMLLATSGFLPVTLTLTCISKYGRQSWYLIMISLLTWLMATATLTTSALQTAYVSLADNANIELYRSPCITPQVIEPEKDGSRYLGIQKRDFQ